MKCPRHGGHEGGLPAATLLGSEQIIWAWLHLARRAAAASLELAVWEHGYITLSFPSSQFAEENFLVDASKRASRDSNNHSAWAKWVSVDQPHI